MSRPLIVFGEDWGRHPSSTQHLVTHLSATRDIIWINSIGLRRPKLTLTDIKRAFGKIRQMLGSPSSQHFSHPLPLHMSVISPRAVSWPGNKLAGSFNRFSLLRQIKAELERRNLLNPIIWTSLPSSIDAIEAFPDTPVIYYCGDDFEALEGVDHVPVKIMEDRLSSKATLILTASQVLTKKFPTEKTYIVPHGVDLNLFQMPVPRPDDLPEHPRIAGFYGSISGWIDVEAIARTARLMPDWLFVLIGAVRTNITCLDILKNVRLLGEKPHGELAAYIQHWTVSLLPFKNTPQIQACNPLKLREYLSVGTPIVSTYFQALEPYANLVEIASYNTDYCTQILAATADTARNSHRSASVANEGWDQRAAYVEALMEKFE